MNLEDLFVSYKQVEPVQDVIRTPVPIEPVYLNIDRAKKVTNNPQQKLSEIEPDEPVDMSSWKVSTLETPINNYRNLLQYLKQKEGFRESVYVDSGGIKTIGYGFTSPDLIAKQYMSEKEASDLLQQEIQERSEKLRRHIKTWDQLNQNQKDALVSYGFNVGVENWSVNQPRLLAALNAGRFKDAAQYMDAVRDRKGNVLPGLVKRRKEEQEWFNS